MPKEQNKTKVLTGFAFSDREELAALLPQPYCRTGFLNMICE